MDFGKAIRSCNRGLCIYFNLSCLHASALGSTIEYVLFCLSKKEPKKDTREWWRRIPGGVFQFGFWSTVVKSFGVSSLLFQVRSALFWFPTHWGDEWSINAEVTVALPLNRRTMKGMGCNHSFLDFSAPVPMQIGSYFLLIQAKESDNCCQQTNVRHCQERSNLMIVLWTFFILVKQIAPPKQVRRRLFLLLWGKLNLLCFT